MGYFQIAKQLTPHNGKQNAATYAWSDKEKNIMFILSCDELRDVCELLKKNSRLFNQNQHKTVIMNNQDPGYDNAFIILLHQRTINQYYSLVKSITINFKSK